MFRTNYAADGTESRIGLLEPVKKEIKLEHKCCEDKSDVALLAVSSKVRLKV